VKRRYRPLNNDHVVTSIRRRNKLNKNKKIRKIIDYSKFRVQNRSDMTSNVFRGGLRTLQHFRLKPTMPRFSFAYNTRIIRTK